jgi:hypothetical protein
VRFGGLRASKDAYIGGMPRPRGAEEFSESPVCYCGWHGVAKVATGIEVEMPAN